MSHPLPAPIAQLLRFSSGGTPNPANRSLLFDLGMDRYDQDGRIPAGQKEAFLQSFAGHFQTPSEDYLPARLRREQALAARGALRVESVARTRLVVGLGLPHPTETGFLFDRITGCPYLPGSSVKGLLRAAARLAAAGELPGASEGWTEADVRRIFGPELGGGLPPQTGSVIFYDAFPVAWPRLEVDVLTPHHREHNDDKAVPAADWDEPNPVPFLTIAPGTRFRFFLGPGDPVAFETDFPRLECLLVTALDCLGIGAKKSSGYGIFGDNAPPTPVVQPQTTRPPERPPGVRPLPPPPSPAVQDVVWTNVELGWHNRVPAAFRGNQTATCAPDRLDPELLNKLRRFNRRGDLRGDVVVVKISGNDFRLDQVRSWRPR